jgi:acyl dehydratase
MASAQSNLQNPSGGHLRAPSASRGLSARWNGTRFTRPVGPGYGILALQANCAPSPEHRWTVRRNPTELLAIFVHFDRSEYPVAASRGLSARWNGVRFTRPVGPGCGILAPQANCAPSPEHRWTVRRNPFELLAIFVHFDHSEYPVAVSRGLSARWNGGRFTRPVGPGCGILALQARRGANCQRCGLSRANIPTVNPSLNFATFGKVDEYPTQKIWGAALDPIISSAQHGDGFSQHKNRLGGWPSNLSSARRGDKSARQRNRLGGLASSIWTAPTARHSIARPIGPGYHDTKIKRPERSR